MLNPKQPLWLPQGSVRAILAVILVVSAVGLALGGLVDPAAIVTLAATVVAFYFASKTARPSA